MWKREIAFERKKLCDGFYAEEDVNLLLPCSLKDWKCIMNDANDGGGCYHSLTGNVLTIVNTKLNAEHIELLRMKSPRTLSLYGCMPENEEFMTTIEREGGKTLLTNLKAFCWYDVISIRDEATDPCNVKGNRKEIDRLLDAIEQFVENHN